jgi:hypothetical protein
MEGKKRMAVRMKAWPAMLPALAAIAASAASHPQATPTQAACHWANI